MLQWLQIPLVLATVFFKTLARHPDSKLTSLVLRQNLRYQEKLRALWRYLRWHFEAAVRELAGYLRLPQGAHEPYRYDYLEGHDSIRFLVLRPGSLVDPIRFSLKVVSLRTEPHFEALSYTWGDAQAQRPTFIGEYVHHVGANLHAALRRLRHRSQQRVLWIDAVCINQSDNDEKSHQVALMQTIYRSGSVLLWVGEDSRIDTEVAAIRLLLRRRATQRRTSERVSHVEWTMPPLVEDQIDALGTFFSRSYFHRVWVIQEIALWSWSKERSRLHALRSSCEGQSRSARSRRGVSQVAGYFDPAKIVTGVCVAVALKYDITPKRTCWQAHDSVSPSSDFAKECKFRVSQL